MQEDKKKSVKEEWMGKQRCAGWGILSFEKTGGNSHQSCKNLNFHLALRLVLPRSSEYPIPIFSLSQ